MADGQPCGEIPSAKALQPPRAGSDNVGIEIINELKIGTPRLRHSVAFRAPCRLHPVEAVEHGQRRAEPGLMLGRQGMTADDQRLGEPDGQADAISRQSLE